MPFAVLVPLLAGGARCEAGDTSAGGSAASPAGLYGEPEVMEFKDGKRGAFTLRFDDSMVSQADVALPHLNARGLVGTFFVNPELDRHKARIDTWEVMCPKFGHELANHTLHHEGAKTYEEAEHEIGECSRYIWKLYPERSRLLPFARGGGTTWDMGDDEMRELTSRYFLFRHRPAHSVCDDPDNEYYSSEDTDLRHLPRRAIDERIWLEVLFHGIGGEWISCSEASFVGLVDFLAENRDKLWVATTGDAWKYQREYQALSGVALTAPSEEGFRIAVECDESKLDTYGLPLTELYDQPLTVRVPVPQSWSHFTVVQGRGKEALADSYETIEVGGQRIAQFDLRPNGPAAVARAESE